MKPLSEFKTTSIQFLFTDIDDTLTTSGRLLPSSYQALWDLYNKGIHVVPVTGRPAGWCELIARQWPVAGVVGENGGLYFRYHNKKMVRHYQVDEATRKENRKRLSMLQDRILDEVPGCAVASDQFCRELDLAIDFCEDVDPLPQASVTKIVDLFQAAGAKCKVSSIHVNGWFGNYDKLTMCHEFMFKEYGENLSEKQFQCAFVGDSPNDEPMFGFFNNSFAVANILKFKDQIECLPSFVASKTGGEGFAEIAQSF